MAKVITIRPKEVNGSTVFEIELGLDKVEAYVPAGKGLSKLSLILDESGKLKDFEIITD